MLRPGNGTVRSGSVSDRFRQPLPRRRLGHAAHVPQTSTALGSMTSRFRDITQKTLGHLWAKNDFNNQGLNFLAEQEVWGQQRSAWAQRAHDALREPRSFYVPAPPHWGSGCQIHTCVPSAPGSGAVSGRRRGQAGIGHRPSHGSLSTISTLAITGPWTTEPDGTSPRGKQESGCFDLGPGVVTSRLYVPASPTTSKCISQVDFFSGYSQTMKGKQNIF